MGSGSRGTSGTNDTTVTEKSTRRWIVNMLKVKKARTKGIVQQVEWNDLGQPIGKGSITLSHYMGSCARRHIPITCDNWRKKDWLNIKEAMWHEIKETFHGIEEKHKNTIISRAGDLHRQFRARLRSLARDDNGNYSMEPPPLYAHMSTVAPYWKEFVEKSLKADFVEKSKKNKERATAMEARYKKACVGYARIREIIIAKKIEAGEKNPIVTRLDAWEYARQNANGVVDDPVTLQVLEDVVEISNQLSEQELTNIGIDDLLARLIPLEYPGRVRALGWGVTKRSLQTTCVSELSKLKNDISFLKNEIEELKRKGFIPGVQSGGSSHMDNWNDDVDGDHDNNHDDVLSEDLPEDKDNTAGSMAAVSSRQLGYPLPQDVAHDGVVEIVRLTVLLDRVTDVEIEMGPYWDGDPWTEHINKENVLEVLNEQWLSASSLTFYIRYLCEVYLSKNPNLAAKVSFASPHIVPHLVDFSEASTNLAKFILGYVDKEHLLLVPYNVSEHWVLLGINTKTESIYFMDPAPKATIVKYPNLKRLVETALVSFRTGSGKTYTKTAFNTFKWTNILCPKQIANDGIFCGHYVGCFIEDVLRSGETNINFTRSNRLMCYARDKLDRFRDNWAGFLYNRFLKGKLLNM